jgi:hypothetical protein
LAKLIGAVAYLISAQNLSDSQTFKSVLTVASGLVLADHLRCHPILKSLSIKLFCEFTLAVSVNFHFNLFQSLFQYRLSDVREEIYNVSEIDRVIFLQESNDVRF